MNLDWRAYSIVALYFFLSIVLSFYLKDPSIFLNSFAVLIGIIIISSIVFLGTGFIALGYLLKRFQDDNELRSINRLQENKESFKFGFNQLRKSSRSRYFLVRVQYVTDRNIEDCDDPVRLFGNERGDDLSFGYCDVSVPHSHKLGVLESPSVLRLEFCQDPEKHIAIQNLAITGKEDFFETLAAKICESKLKSTFLFVHGFSVSFEDAARRTAQMAYDLKFDGAPVFYSWPTQGSKAAYLIDSQNSEWSQKNLKTFLQDFFEKSDAENVYLIAHSMGNRALLSAVASLLKEAPEIRKRLKEIILTAPDIDAEVFKRDIAPVIGNATHPATLYASSHDVALTLSKKINGFPRAGDSGSGLVITSGIETIDASDIDTSFIGHSYFGDNRSVLSDLYYLIRREPDDNRKSPGKRFGLIQVDTELGTYWKFKK